MKEQKIRCIILEIPTFPLSPGESLSKRFVKYYNIIKTIIDKYKTSKASKKYYKTNTISVGNEIMIELS